MKLYPYQIQDAAHLAAKDAAYFVGDCGVGKTAISITAAKQIGAKRVLVICPAVARVNWVREVGRWWPEARANAVLKPVKRLPDGEVVVVGYDTLARAKPAFMALFMDTEWDALIADEAHMLKNTEAKRTRAVFGPKMTGADGLIAKAKRTWLLSATPMPSHAGELFAPIRALAPETIQTKGRPMTEFEFGLRYTLTRDTPFGIQVTGSRNLPELRSKTEHLFYRRRKADVLKDLPSLTITEVELSGEVEDKSMWNQVVARIEAAVDVQNPADTLVTLESDAVALSTERRLSGLLKAPMVAEHIKMALDGGEPKVVVFAHHTDVIARLSQLLTDYNPVIVNGATPIPTRQKAIDSFQQEASTRVFIGQINSAGTAITLTAASRVVMAEASWVPAENHQAMSRCHRIGQSNPVLVEFMAFGAIDAAIQRALARKAADIDLMIG